jgi:DNA-binding CsgD family transcriptional regulator
MGSIIGLILVDSGRKPLYACRVARSILCGTAAVRGTLESLNGRIVALLDQVGVSTPESVINITVEGNPYLLSQIPMAPVSTECGPLVAIILQRDSNQETELKAIARKYRLTHREEEVLALVLQGLAPKEIGGRLGISSSTTKSFVRILIAKIGVSGRPEMIAKLLQLNR